jgi:hypothetical protein
MGNDDWLAAQFEWTSRTTDSVLMARTWAGRDTGRLPCRSFRIHAKVSAPVAAEHADSRGTQSCR